MRAELSISVSLRLRFTDSKPPVPGRVITVSPPPPPPPTLPPMHTSHAAQPLGAVPCT